MAGAKVLHSHAVQFAKEKNILPLLDALDLLARNAIPVFGITATSFRISLLVPRQQVENSVRLCHTRWVADNSI